MFPPLPYLKPTILNLDSKFFLLVIPPHLQLLQLLHHFFLLTSVVSYFRAVRVANGFQPCGLPHPRVYLVCLRSSSLDFYSWKHQKEIYYVIMLIIFIYLFIFWLITSKVTKHLFCPWLVFLFFVVDGWLLLGCRTLIIISMDFNGLCKTCLRHYSQWSDMKVKRLIVVPQALKK